MKFELKISKEVKQLFRGLNSAKSVLQGLQFYITESFIDIGGIDTGRVKLSMLRIPHKDKKPIEPITIEPSVFLSMITHLLDNETITIEDYKRDKNTGVRIVCNDREFTFTEDCPPPAIKPTSLNKIYSDEKTDYLEFSMEWKEWSYILRELNLMGFDTFDFSTRNGDLWIDAEGHYYTYKRKIISLSKCRKKTEITKVTFAMRNFDRNIYQPIKINIKDDDPICLTFEHEGITLKQWIAPRIEDDDYD